MSTRRAHPSDKFRIATVKDRDGQPLRRGPARAPRWDWELRAHPLDSDDTVLLPRIYHRPNPTRHGIRQELVLNWDSPVPVVKLDSHAMACRALLAVLRSVRRPAQ